MVNKNTKVKKFLSIVLGIVVGIIFALPYFLFREQIQSMATIGYIGLFVSCLISNLSILLPTSSTIIIVAAALTLNPWICIIVGGLGTAFGEQASYLCGLVGHLGFEKDTSEKKQIAIRWFDKNPFFAVFLFAFIPLPVFDIIGIIAGIKKMKWWKYTIAAVLGKVLKFLFVVVALFYVLPFLLDKLPWGLGKTLNDILEQLLANAK